MHFTLFVTCCQLLLIKTKGGAWHISIASAWMPSWRICAVSWVLRGWQWAWSGMILCHPAWCFGFHRCTRPWKWLCPEYTEACFLGHRLSTQNPCLLTENMLPASLGHNVFSLLVVIMLKMVSGMHCKGSKINPDIHPIMHLWCPDYF